jgi:hypothetical protein
MIDFLKLANRDRETVEYFRSHESLNWIKDSSTLNYDNETIKSKTLMHWNNILFEFFDDSMIIRLKPHYLFNDNAHNANDFSSLNCIDLLSDFRDSFQVDFDQFEVQNIEFGVNVRSSIPIEDLIMAIKYHNKNEFRNHRDLAYSKEAYSIDKKGRANKYKTIKAYSKGHQYPKHCNRDTFRFEVKSKQSKYLKTVLGVYCYSDLLIRSTYSTFSKVILEEFDSLLILDGEVNFSSLTEREKGQLNKYLNQDSWYRFLQQNRNSFHRHLTKYNSLIEKTGGSLFKEMRNRIEKKLNSLLVGCNFHNLEQEKEGADSSIYKGGMCNPKQCIVTGLNISMQKDDSKMLSHTGIKYYLNNDFEVFRALKEKFLSDNWSSADLKIQISEIAHNIRNTDSNRNISEKRRYPDFQINLLDQMNISTNTRT